MNINQDLVLALKRWRYKEAVANGVPSYMILSNMAVESIATHHPESISNLSTLHGMGEKTALKYGNEIIAIVKEFPGSDTTPQPKDQRWHHVLQLIQEYDQMGIKPNREVAMRLNEWRDLVAQSTGDSYFFIFSDKALVNLSIYCPKTITALGMVPGISRKTTEVYGSDIIAVIQR